MSETKRCERCDSGPVVRVVEAGRYQAFREALCAGCAGDDDEVTGVADVLNRLGSLDGQTAAQEAACERAWRETGR